jgi:hypothetical protein
MDHPTSIMQSILEAGTSLMAAIEEGNYERAFALAERRAELVIQLEIPALLSAKAHKSPGDSSFHTRENQNRPSASDNTMVRHGDLFA